MHSNNSLFYNRQCLLIITEGFNIFWWKTINYSIWINFLIDFWKYRPKRPRFWRVVFKQALSVSLCKINAVYIKQNFVNLCFVQKHLIKLLSGELNQMCEIKTCKLNMICTISH